MKLYQLNVYILSFLMMLLASVSFKAIASVTLSSYNMTITKAPQDLWQIESEIEFSQLSVDKLSLILNKSAKINNITLASEPLSYKFEKDGSAPNIYIDDGRTLSIDLPKKIDEVPSSIVINYSLPSEAVNYLKDEVNFESGLYSAWYPLNIDYGKFTYDLTLINFNEKVAGNGQVIRSKDKISLYNDKSDIDIVLLVSPSLLSQEFKIGDSLVLLHSIGAASELSVQLEKHIIKILALYENNFGKLAGLNNRYQFVLVPRTSGPSYSRNNFAVMTEFSGDKYSALFKTLAHEIGHFWWNRSVKDTWENWLDESFAEYSALMAVEDVFGKDKKTEWLDHFSKTSASLPAIRGLARNSKYAQSVLYKKGPVLLSELHDLVGEQKFQLWLKTLNKKEAAKTDELIAITGEILGAEAVEFIKTGLLN